MFYDLICYNTNIGYESLCAGYRLRILRVNDLPVHTTYDGRTFEFQLGVSLYDEAYGVFYGNTVGVAKGGRVARLWAG